MSPCSESEFQRKWIAKWKKVGKIAAIHKGCQTHTILCGRKRLLNLFTFMAEFTGQQSFPHVSNILPKGAPLSANPARLSVLSYNLLAPIYVRPIDSRTGAVQEFAAFAWAEPADEVLDWSMRMPKLLEELRNSNADVICLQEVQFDNNGNGDFELPLQFRELEGYEYRIGAQSSLREIADRNKRVLNNEAAVGNAVLWRTDRLQPMIDNSVKDANTRVTMCFRGRSGGGLDHLGPTSVVSVHLDATSEEQRVKQLTKALETGRQLGTRNVIIAGDMNTECLPGSCVNEMIVNNEVAVNEEQVINECISAYRLSKEEIVSEELKTTWNSLRKHASEIPSQYRIKLKRVTTGETRAAYDHGATMGPCKSWKLDHIFYSHEHLACVERWSTLEHDVEAASLGLPNHNCPSDHLPVAAIFHVYGDRSLSENETNELISGWKLLQSQFQQEKDDLCQKYDDDLAILESAQQSNKQSAESSVPSAAELEEEISGTNNKKKKKPKKERPSNEMVALMRRKREALKLLSTRQERTLLDVVSRLVDAELDVAEHMGLFGLKLPSSTTTKK